MHSAWAARFLVTSLCWGLLLASGCGGGGGGGSNGAAVQPAPQNDSFSWVGNTRLSVSAGNGLLANDPPGTLITNADSITGQGGAVAVNLATGAFVYDPPVGLQNAADTFGYTAEGVAITVTISLDERVWYVRNNDPGAAQGTLLAPFRTLTQAEAAADEHDTIFVFAGDQTDTGQDSGITLKDGQRLIGEGVGLRIKGVPVVAPVPEALVSNAALAAVDQPVVRLATANEVAGFIIEPARNEGILAVGGGGYHLHDNIIRNFDPDNGREGIRLLNVSGANLLTRNTISGSPRTAILLANNENEFGDPVPAQPVVARVTASRNTITDTDRSQIRARFDGVATEVALNLLTNTLANPVSGGAEPGIAVDSLGGASVTTLISRNGVTASGAEAINLQAGANSQLRAFAANGNLADSGAPFDFRAATAASSANLCLELINNLNAASNSTFQVDNGASGTFRFFEDLNDALADRIAPIISIAESGCGILLDGVALFEANCGHCHRGNGLGQGAVGPDVTNGTADEINLQITNNFSMGDINLTQQEITAIAAALTARP